MYQMSNCFDVMCLKGKDDNNSHCNPFEAEFIMQLAHYIFLQGVAVDKITVLTPYSGQFFLLRKVSNVSVAKLIRV